MTVWGTITGLLGDDFDDIELLGRGGSGTVYRATQISLGRTVAVKVFQRLSDGAADRVLDEGRAQASLSWQANVISLYEQGTTPDGFGYLVMEYAPGGSLRDRVDATGPLPESEWRRIGADVAGALAAAHDAGVVHCDVKPSNILFAADGSARLADFGIARAAGVDTSTLDSIEGSLAYVPPELLDGEPPTRANDVYSLALTLLYAATGKQPFSRSGNSEAATMARIRTERVSVSDQLAWLERDAAGALQACVDKNPAVRPPAAALAAVLRRTEAATSPPGRPQRVGRSPRLRAAASALMVLAMLGTVLVVGRWTGAEAAPPLDLCAAFEEYVGQRSALFDEVSADLEQATEPREVVERLLIRYPAESARIVRPFMMAVGGVAGVSIDVTAGQLAQLSRADALRSISGGKEFLFDGQTGSLDPMALPSELQATATQFSEANRVAARRCPQVVVDLAAGKARMSSAIYSNLVNPQFMDGFFGDPGSFELFDADLVLILLQVGREYVENLLEGHWEWLLGMLEHDPQIRAAVLLEHPDLMLRAASEDRAVLTALARPEWRDELETGYRLSSPAARLGMLQLYREQTTILQLGEVE